MNDWIVMYCERQLSGTEWLNTVTNLAFVFVGVLALYYRRRDTNDKRYLVAGMLAIAIGIGSALFHRDPQPLTQALDIAPIALLTLLCGVTLTYRHTRASRAACTTIGIGWLLASIVAAQFPDILAGSMFYLPTGLWLVILAMVSQSLRRSLVPIAAIFWIALSCRAVDLPFCQSGYPPIWHGLWHLLTAICIGLLMRLLHQPGHRMATPDNTNSPPIAEN